MTHGAKINKDRARHAPDHEHGIRSLPQWAAHHERVLQVHVLTLEQSHSESHRGNKV